MYPSIYHPQPKWEVWKNLKQRNSNMNQRLKDKPQNDNNSEMNKDTKFQIHSFERKDNKAINPKM